jgi:hypothetical protein
MEEQLALGTTDSYILAQKIYEEGAYSKSYAEVTLSTELSGAVQEDAEAVGKDASGGEVRGRAMESATKGATTLQIQYATTDIQASYVNCQVGALEELGNTEGCKGTFFSGTNS